MNFIDIANQALKALNTARIISIGDNDETREVTPSVIREAINSLEQVVALANKPLACEEELADLAREWAAKSYAYALEYDNVDVSGAIDRFYDALSNFKVEVAAELIEQGKLV